MHWRRVTANRVRQRGGKPKPRRATEPKSDWPVAMLPGTTRSVPSIEPSTYTTEVHRLERNTLRVFHNLLEKEVYFFAVSKAILSFLLSKKRSLGLYKRLKAISKRNSNFQISKHFESSLKRNARVFKFCSCCNPFPSVSLIILTSLRIL